MNRKQKIKMQRRLQSSNSFLVSLTLLRKRGVQVLSSFVTIDLNFLRTRCLLTAKERNNRYIMLFRYTGKSTEVEEVNLHRGKFVCKCSGHCHWY